VIRTPRIVSSNRQIAFRIAISLQNNIAASDIIAMAFNDLSRYGDKYTARSHYFGGVEEHNWQSTFIIVQKELSLPGNHIPNNYK
jgi:hypothetical protein